MKTKFSKKIQILLERRYFTNSKGEFILVFVVVLTF